MRVNVNISDEVHKWYKEEADKIGTSMSSMMAIALNEYMRERVMMKEFKGFGELIDKIQKIQPYGQALNQVEENLKKLDSKK